MDLPGTRLPKGTKVHWLLGHSNGRFWSKLPPSLVLFCSWLRLRLHGPCSAQTRSDGAQKEGRRKAACSAAGTTRHLASPKRQRVRQSWWQSSSKHSFKFFTIAITYSVVGERTWCPHPEPFQGCFCGSTSESAQSSTDHGQQDERSRV